jgi:hypothetical protein
MVGLCNDSLAYSLRRESIGFRFAARIDGMRLAATVTTASGRAGPVRVAGSRGFNPLLVRLFRVDRRCRPS